MWLGGAIVVLMVVVILGTAVVKMIMVKLLAMGVDRKMVAVVVVMNKKVPVAMIEFSGDSSRKKLL